METRFRIGLSLAGLGLGLIVALRLLSPLVTPFLFGFLLAVCIEPAAGWLERKLRLSRSAAVALALGMGVLVLALGVGLIVFQVTTGLRMLLTGHLPGETFFRWLDRFVAGTGWWQKFPQPFRETVILYLRSLPERLGGFLRVFWASLRRVPEGLGGLFFGLISAYFFARDREAVDRFLLRLLPSAWRKKARMLGREITLALAGILRAQFSLFLFTFILGSLGLMVLNIRPAWFIGALLGYLDLLPFIGPGMVLLPWAGFHLATGNWGKGMGLVGLFLLLAVVHELLEARLVGRNLRLHPLATLVSIYGGLRLFGPVGVIYGPIFLFMFRALYRVLLLTAAEEGLAKT